MKTCCKSADTW